VRTESANLTPDIYLGSDEFPREDGPGFGDGLELNQFDGLPFSSRYYKLLKERKSLSVWKVRREFEDALANNQLVIPQWCAEFCLSARYQHGMVVCTQTNKQQVVNLALRVADEMDVNIGHEVGYIIPLETCCSADTVLRFMMSDPFLEHYGAIIIDQAHERTVSTDILLGLLKDILLQRPELRVVVLTVSSMTDKLLGHYGSIPLISVETSLYFGLLFVNPRGEGDLTNPLPYFYLQLLLQEVLCAQSILQREGTRLGGDLGEMVPVVLHAGQGGLLPFLTKQSGSKMSRRVFLSTQQGEDMWWAAESVNFVIDTGVQKKMVRNSPSCFLKPPAGMTHEAIHCHRKFQHPEGDHFTLINIYNAFKQNQREQYFSVEKWCQDYFLDHSALKTAEAIRSELTDTLNRIELPISDPSFGTKTNTLNIKRALLAGFFMQIARDVDGSGNYFILTHKHMTHIHPLSSYGAQSQKLGLPEWVVFHEYTLSENNCMRTVSEISPQV
uniref:DEAD-box helicase OB fold domain-containing protein n=1 Tax=Echeneis naucrates TaxID=173247 RepID=A0A665WME9_ECHNA